LEGRGTRLKLKVRGGRLEANGKVKVEAEVEEEQVLRFAPGGRLTLRLRLREKRSEV